VLVGASSKHAFYVCTIHQNVKLMISGTTLYNLTEKEVKAYDNCLFGIICNVPCVSCYQRHCEMCLGTEKLVRNTEQRFEENNIDDITCIQWMITDRSTLEKASTFLFVCRFSMVVYIWCTVALLCICLLSL
jgi:hypothetical protein